MHICLNCGSEGEPVRGGACALCGGPAVPLRKTGDSFSGRVLGDKYVVLKALGRGGMGSVYLGKHRTLDKNVAIKVMNVAFANNPSALRRFYAEARNAGSLEHPHNVKIFDFGHEEDGIVFIVMEVVRGKSMANVPMPMDSRRVLRICIQICGAIGEAHQRGLVHRDLKPDNIMLGLVDGQDFVRVLDYGIAKFANSSTGLTNTGMIVGTPEYLSPEQATGDKVDSRSDIYSLGAMMYQMVTGRPPFRADTVMGLAFAHIQKPPEPPSNIAPVPHGVEKIILQCLAKDRGDRPQTMEALRDRLERLLDADSLEGSGEFVQSAEPADPTEPGTPDTLGSLEFGIQRETLSEPVGVFDDEVSEEDDTTRRRALDDDDYWRRAGRRSLLVALVVFLVAGGAIGAYSVVVGGQGDNTDNELTETARTAPTQPNDLNEALSVVPPDAGVSNEDAISNEDVVSAEAALGTAPDEGLPLDPEAFALAEAVSAGSDQSAGVVQASTRRAEAISGLEHERRREQAASERAEIEARDREADERQARHDRRERAAERRQREERAEAERQRQADEERQAREADEPEDETGDNEPAESPIERLRRLNENLEN